MNKKEIYLAGSSFWGGKAFLEALPGVEEVELGLADIDSGTVVDNIWSAYPDSEYLGTTEVCKVIYDADTISLPLLMEAFFTTIDPHSIAKQINYSGSLPEPKVYYTDPADEVVIEQQIAKLQQHHERPVTIECIPMKKYAPVGVYAEDYIKRNLGVDKVVPVDAAEKFVAAHKDEFGA